MPLYISAVAPLRSLWKGASKDGYATAAVLATTAVALLLLQPELDLPSAQREADKLWQDRDTSRLA